MLKTGTIGFAILRLSTEIEVLGETITIGNLLGYLPVFATKDEAIAASNGGKFKILEIALGEGKTEVAANV